MRYIQMEQKNIQTSQSDQLYREYSYRWVIVLLVSLSFLVNALANNAVIPIAQKLSSTYGLSDAYVDSPVFISFLIYSLMNFPANHFIDKFGLRFSLILGTLLYAIGLLLFSFINKGYYFVLIGAVIVAIGQPFVINCPSKIAAEWFKIDNRTLATGILVGINIIGTGVGFVTPTLAVKEQSLGETAKIEVESLYWRYFLVGFIVCILQIIFMRKRPPTPTSKSSSAEKIDVLESFQKIRSDSNLSKFFISYILLYGTFLTNGAISNQLLKPFGYEDLQIALIGVATIISGVAGAIFYSYRIKVTKDFKGVLTRILGISVCVLIAYALWLAISAQIYVTLLLAIILGFNFAPVVPITYDLGCQLAFPIGQAQIIGILNGGSMILTFILTSILSNFVGFGSVKQSCFLFFIFCVLIGFGAYSYSRVQIVLKRSEFESESKQKDKQMMEVKDIKYGSDNKSIELEPGYQIMNEQS